jgi:chemotaxis protein methyltransferase CheR
MMARAQPPAQADRDLDRATRILADRCGLRFHQGNRELLDEGLRRAAHAEGDTTARLLERLERDPSGVLLQAVVRHFTIGETYFFRHPEHFDALREQILPELMRHRRTTRMLRAWSAGCASGEEAWSLAMVLASQVEAGFTFTVLGTDINRAALEAARTGVYGAWSRRGSMPGLPRHLVEEPDGAARVSSELRERVRFEYLNLHDPVYPSLSSGTQGLDLIFCRNVLVYFQPEAARAVLERFHLCLVEGGYLVTSAFDAELAPAGFETVRVGQVMVLRKRHNAAEPVAPRRAWPRTPMPAKDATGTAPKVPSPEALAQLRQAKLAADEGDLVRATVLIRDTLARERTPEGLHLLAMVLGERGERGEALRMLRATVEESPDYILGRLSLGLSDDEEPGARAGHLRRVLELLGSRREVELLDGLDEPLAVSLVRRMAMAALRRVEVET